MASGNFILGEGLKLKGFEEYVKPVLNKYRVKASDFLEYREGLNEKIFISLSVDSSPSVLERAVSISLNTASKKAKEDHSNKKNHEEYPSAWEHQLYTYEGPKMEKIGLYQDNETASKIFQTLAPAYSIQTAIKELERAKDEIDTILEGIGKRD